MALVHETVRAEQAARRQGTASTKTRGEVSRRRRQAVEAEGAPVAPAPAPHATRCGPAAVPRSARSRVATPSRSTARPAGSHCGARCRFTLSAVRSHSSTRVCSTRRRPSRPTACWTVGAQTLGRSSCSPERAQRRAVVPQHRPCAGAPGRGRRRRQPDRRRAPARLRGCAAGVGRARQRNRPRTVRSDGRDPDHHPPRRLREDLRAGRGSASTPSASPTRRTRPRSARRSRSCSTSRSSASARHRSRASPSAAARPPAAHASGRRRSCRFARAIRSRSSAGWKGPSNGHS